MYSFKKRFCAMQFELKAPKNQRNTFGNYNYRSCEDIVEATKPLFRTYSLGLNLTDEIVEIGGRNYVKATATVFDQEGEEYRFSCGYAREPETKKGMDDSQVTGAASSYARKYALNGVLGIDDTKDADTDAYARVCADCGREITDHTEDSGSRVTAAQISARSLKSFGKMLCWDCAMAQKKEEVK